ncbi:MAG: hypothetical protein QW039_04125 [Fervidicoccaceae archaeon]
MEMESAEVLEFIDRKLSQFCSERREWKVLSEKIKALKPLSSNEETVEKKLVNGIIVVDKPPGPTSHEIVAYVKRMLNVNKAGHGGTLEG